MSIKIDNILHELQEIYTMQLETDDKFMLKMLELKKIDIYDFYSEMNWDKKYARRIVENIFN